MKLIHNIVTKLPDTRERRILSNYNTVDQVLSCNESLGLDGIYKNVYENKHVLEGKDVFLFVMGDYIGGDNSFDTGMPLEHYCSLEELEELANMGCKLGWHTWSHPDLTKLSDDEIRRELNAPEMFKEYFAYPYGKISPRVVELVKEAGFKKAYSVFETDGTDYTIPRSYL